MTIEGMEFCYVPPGPFIMGSGDDDPLANADEKPQHTYDIPYGYWIGRYPVTNAQFAPFVKAGGYANATWWTEAQAVGFWQQGKVQDVYYMVEGDTLVRYFEGWRSKPKNFGRPVTFPNHPRITLSWYEALAYTHWLTTYLHDNKLLPIDWSVHLPNEPEWEKSARGGLELPLRPLHRKLGGTAWQTPTFSKTRKNTQPERHFPWGNALDANRANCEETQIETTNAVGAFPRGASPYGIEELSGNFWEWTRSLWGEGMSECTFVYPYHAHDGRELLDVDLAICRVGRGGAFNFAVNSARLSVRRRYRPVSRYNALRVVLSPSTFGL